MFGRTLTLTGAALLFAIPAAAQDDGESLDALAERLIEMRAEVERLHDEIESRQQQHRSRMNSLAQRRAGLEAEIQGKQLQLKKLQRALEENRAQIKSQDDKAAELKPLLDDLARLLTTYVEGGLPFQIEDRLAGPQKVLEQVEAGDMSSPKAINRLWGLYEDEFRIVKENGLFRQEIVVDGNEQLADVIRLGGLMLFFKTGDGQLGYAKQQNDDWVYTALEGDGAERVRELFASFEKQVRTGFFVVPNPLEMN